MARKLPGRARGAQARDADDWIDDLGRGCGNSGEAHRANGNHSNHRHSPLLRPLDPWRLGPPLLDGLPPSGRRTALARTTPRAVDRGTGLTKHAGNPATGTARGAGHYRHTFLEWFHDQPPSGGNDVSRTARGSTARLGRALRLVVVGDMRRPWDDDYLGVRRHECSDSGRLSCGPLGPHPQKPLLREIDREGGGGGALVALPRSRAQVQPPASLERGLAFDGDEV